jgi:HK97 family phage prohead protease
MKTLHTYNKAVESLNEAKRQITFTASTNSVDRYGDVVEPMGIDTKAYEANPVVLAFHDASVPPVGKCVAISKSKTALTTTVQFATADENPEADTIYKLYKGGYMNAVSIGFLPKAQEWITGNGESMPTGVHYLEIELLEVSCVPVPANPEALAKSAGEELASCARILRVKGWEPYAEPAQKEPVRPLDSDLVALLKKLTAPKISEAQFGAFLKSLTVK